MQRKPPRESPQREMSQSAWTPHLRWMRLRIGTGASAGQSMRAFQAALTARRRQHEATARSAQP